MQPQLLGGQTEANRAPREPGLRGPGQSLLGPCVQRRRGGLRPIGLEHLLQREPATSFLQDLASRKLLCQGPAAAATAAAPKGRRFPTGRFQVPSWQESSSLQSWVEGTLKEPLPTTGTAVQPTVPSTAGWGQGAGRHQPPCCTSAGVTNSRSLMSNAGPGPPGDERLLSHQHTTAFSTKATSCRDTCRVLPTQDCRAGWPCP